MEMIKVQLQNRTNAQDLCCHNGKSKNKNYYYWVIPRGLYHFGESDLRI
jgi:hypothetical protein